MSDPFFDDEDVAVDHSRRRAVWGLSVLVMLAVIVVTVAVLFTGTHKGGPSNEGGGIDISTLSGAEPSSTASTRPRPPRSTTPSDPVSSSGPSSSPSSSSPGSSSSSAGPGTAGLAAGINALRASQHLQAVPATHSTAADECAAARGGGPTCVPHYMYAQVASQDPAVALAALEGVNKSWLLDAGTTRIEIGWSKLSSGGFNCAVLKFP